MSSLFYRAVHAVGPGRLELTEKPLIDPPAGQVRIRLEACGVCHSDAATVEGAFPIRWPRVPGHEAVGSIDAVGEGVSAWSVGQRVGVGYLAGSCGYCEFCRAGDLVCCRNQTFTGVQLDGGYADVMLAKQSALMAIPDALASIAAAPLLCAGITTFGALRRAPAKTGELVAVLGIGGLGTSPCSTHGTWASRSQPSAADPTSERLPRSSAPTTTSTAPLRTRVSNCRLSAVLRWWSRPLPPAQLSAKPSPG